MSKQNKWSGNFGKVASGGSSTGGGNGSGATKSPSAPRSSSSVSDNVITCKTGPGDDMGTSAISTHNSINAFTRGIKSRGPYGGPTFASLNHYEPYAKSSDTSRISKFTTPSGGGRSSGTAGGSGYMAGKAPSRTNDRGSQASRMGRSNKNGSGYQNLA